MTLTDVQNERIAWLKTFFDEAMYSPISYMSTTFQFTKDTWQYVRDYVFSYLPNGTGFSSSFTVLDINNNPVAMTFTQAMGLIQLSASQGLTAWQRLQSDINKVMTATTIAEVYAVMW